MNQSKKKDDESESSNSSFVLSSKVAHKIQEKEGNEQRGFKYETTEQKAVYLEFNKTTKRIQIIMNLKLEDEKPIHSVSAGQKFLRTQSKL